MVNSFRDMQKLFPGVKRLIAVSQLLVFLGIATSVRAQEENRNSRLRIQFDIDRQGRPSNLEVLESSGNKKFDRATLEAMEEMRFERSDANRTGISADINIEFNGLNAYVYPPEVVKSFVDGCNNGKEDNKEFCLCMIQQAQKQYSLETFLTVSLGMSSGNISPQTKEFFQYILSSCITQVPIEQFLPSAPVPINDSQ